MKRPSVGGNQDASVTTTPKAARMVELLGPGITADHVALTRDEFLTIKKLYGFKSRRDVQELIQAGSDRNVIRHAQCDGLRLLAWISKFTDAGGDPLKTLIQLAIDAGLDVDCADIDWVSQE